MVMVSARDVRRQGEDEEDGTYGTICGPGMDCQQSDWSNQGVRGILIPFHIDRENSAVVGLIAWDCGGLST
jgi:hypothetical protein